MKTFSSAKRRALLIGGVVNLLILCILVVATIGPSQGIQAQMADNQQDSFSVFCNFYYHVGKDLNADADITACSKQSNTLLSLLQQEASDNYKKWPKQASLNDLATAGQLVDPQTKSPINTPHDFQTAIPAADGDLLSLLQGDGEFLPALWDYNSTYDNILPCGTATSNSELSSSSNCSNQPNQAPNCPINPQSFKHSDIWPTVGPMFLATISQELQDQKGQALGTYDIYGRLLLKAHCSMATLAQTLQLNRQPIQPNQAYLLEQDTLVQVAIANASNTPLLLALVWAVTQNNYQQLDNWFSAAMLTDPINLHTQPPSDAQSTPGSTPTPDAQSTPSSTPTPDAQSIPNLQPTFSPLSGISVPSSASKSAVQQVKIVKKDGKYTFEPPILIIPKGTTVEWINNSDTVQKIASDSSAFPDSSSFEPTKTLQMVFNTTGPFPYHSGTNPDAKAIVLVAPS